MVDALKRVFPETTTRGHSKVVIYEEASLTDVLFKQGMSIKVNGEEGLFAAYAQRKTSNQHACGEAIVVLKDAGAPAQAVIVVHINNTSEIIVVIADTTQEDLVKQSLDSWLQELPKSHKPTRSSRKESRKAAATPKPAVSSADLFEVCHACPSQSIPLTKKKLIHVLQAETTAAPTANKSADVLLLQSRIKKGQHSGFCCSHDMLVCLICEHQPQANWTTKASRKITRSCLRSWARWSHSKG